jgi:hypothetical protein
VTCCCWVAISACTIAFVSRPDARPVTCIGVPDPSELSWSPVLYWLELVADVLDPTDDVDMAC